jgi:hypothetical protein
MIQTMATFGYYAAWILIALAVIFIVAPLMAAPLVGLAVCTGGWALPGFPLIAMIAISYFLTAIWCGYWVYYRPARMDNEAAYPETWKR